MDDHVLLHSSTKLLHALALYAPGGGCGTGAWPGGGAEEGAWLDWASELGFGEPDPAGGFVVVDPLSDFFGAGADWPPVAEVGSETVGETGGGTREVGPTGSSATGPGGEEVPPLGAGTDAVTCPDSETGVGTPGGTTLRVET